MTTSVNFLQALRVPLIQAPMAGGVSTPVLAGTVAAAGAIGSLGFAYSSPERIAADLTQATALARGGVLNANFFVFRAVPADATLGHDAEDARAVIDRVIAASGLAALSVVLPETPWFPDLIGQLEPVWDLRPAILSFHFGLPPHWVIERAHDLGIKVAVTATSLDEARRIAKAGADYIVAQGIEAGGHRGLFDPLAVDEAWTTEALVRHLRAAGLDRPVIAAGGAMNGADLRRLMGEGAAAVQMGTAFLCCPESGASQAHRRLCAEGTRETVLTTGLSGRPARGIRNRFIDAMQGQPVLPFPLQNTLTGGVRAAAVAADDAEHQSLWAGMGFSQARAMGAGALIQVLIDEWGI